MPRKNPHRQPATQRLNTSLAVRAAQIRKRHEGWRSLREEADRARSHGAGTAASRVRIDFEDLERPFQIVTQPFGAGQPGREDQP